MCEISVIIPSYQHAATLPDCLDAVFAQTLQPKEIIVVNDGSTDETDTVVEPYKEFIHYEKQENQGGQRARNRGFELSTAPFVIFLDADAVMKPCMLELLCEALQKHPKKGFAYSAFRFGWKKFKSFPYSAERLRKMNFIHTSALIRREAFPGFDESVKRFQDWDLWLTMMENGWEGVRVSKELFRIMESKGRIGISRWRPSWYYRLPWKRLGVRSDIMERYESAREAIYEKHNLWT